jgi:hypothetical protein
MAPDEQQTASLSGAGGSTTACLNFCNVFANGLLHGGAELACHLVRTAGLRLQSQSVCFPCAEQLRHTFRLDNE